MLTFQPALASAAEWAVRLLALLLADASICYASSGLCGSTNDSLGGARVRRGKATLFCPRSTQAADEQCRYEESGNGVVFWRHEAQSIARMTAIR